MKFSESWLREWVNPAISTEELSEQITMAGLEVDAVEPVAGAFTGVVVGHVVECAQHPDADKLRVTKVDVGAGEPIDIVCGAPNCRQGLKVCCATVGAVLPGDFKIKKAKLRGQPSEGMLCSFDELAIPVESDGIIELPADAPVGMDVREYLKLNDNAIEIGLTPNRADCLGMLGIAREVGVLNRLPVTEPQISPVAASIDNVMPIKVSAPDACPRYLGRVIKGIDANATSPLWMQEKLRRCGIRSIDPVVDVTNYILLEMGQPMHAFDHAKIDGGIVVRMAEEGEKLTLLDGNEVTLRADTLVVADHSRPLAMAGIFGGEYSGVTAETKDVLLECAFFSPLSITGRARAYGLHTDSSHRFERGVDYAVQNKAMERATALLLEICGGEAGPVVDVTSAAHLPQAATITLRRSKLDALIGYHVEDDVVTDILTRLGCQVSKTAEGWTAVAPSWRFDMEIEEDLVEEVARIFGYNNIPNEAPLAELRMNDHREANLPLKRVKAALVDKGYQEAITYSFVDPKVQALLHPGEEAMILPNPISVDMSAMRLSLWSGLIGAAVYNQNRQQPRVRIFESGLRFVPDAAAENGVRQEVMLAGLLTGNRSNEHWGQESKTVDFFDMKGDLEAVLELTGRLDDVKFEVCSNPALHPGQSAALVLDGEQIGFIGALHPELERKLDLNGRTMLFEVLWDKISQRTITSAQSISRFPANRRDIAIVVNESVSAQNIIDECRKVGGNQLVGVNLFDVYRGKGVNDGCKSLAISLTLQDTSRTLEEEEIANAVSGIVEALKVRFQASLRD
ncbi:MULTISPECIES: phenylalanine--tRNA ligase subunit beta [Plesiomonas]|uniref:phenylalanine--tRNA ligase subunit beta n=1 Tax=Plesiomonas TaxID=702 RepID=UPI000D56DCAA|nr:MULTISPECIES: phenylalanine--tRNA ligase subunit beta [Plesiomonas]KAB7674734.1 phenylalanine--tRNA ligase subunit beta [Plesiomonas shigelloides]KAB7687232.1 phenylalanine--tRNA ligase subunit beta [Plesiomonas shigelloides]MCE5163653.1 phenylalanine--tRNA ligase subunit beta [Plesiomonas sp. PI-19]MCQ8857337.1 phenylalanine--tRNA ligase subunit beta [Plesiomonas shigelloides]PVU66528.1 phenylalanine--tRNA ligase subunit beta [Plesiomonas shigelloides]